MNNIFGIVLGLLVSSSFFEVHSSQLKTPPIIEEAFVTFATKDYFPLLEVTIASVHAFSKRPIIAYGINDDIPFDSNKYPHLIKRRINDFNMGMKPYIYFQKMNIILQSNVKYGIYIESDDVVNYCVDELFEKCRQVKLFPLCPIHPQDPNNQHRIMQLLGVTKKTNPYVHGHIIFSQECLPFIQECYDTCKKYAYQLWGANWDETVLNVMLWKHNVHNWHTHIYDPWFEFVANYLQGQNSFMLEGHPATFHMLHGCKQKDQAWLLLEKLKVAYARQNKTIVS